MSSNSHPSATTNKARHCLNEGGGGKAKEYLIILTNQMRTLDLKRLYGPDATYKIINDFLYIWSF